MGFYILTGLVSFIIGMFLNQKLTKKANHLPVGQILNSLSDDTVACEVIAPDKVFDTVEDAQDLLNKSTGVKWFIEDTEETWALIAVEEDVSRIILRVNKSDQLGVAPIEDDANLILDSKNFILDELISNTGIILENHEKVLIFINDYLKFNEPTPSTVSLLSKIRKVLFENPETVNESN